MAKVTRITSRKEQKVDKSGHSSLRLHLYTLQKSRSVTFVTFALFALLGSRKLTDRAVIDEARIWPRIPPWITQNGQNRAKELFSSLSRPVPRVDSGLKVVNQACSERASGRKCQKCSFCCFRGVPDVKKVVHRGVILGVILDPVLDSTSRFVLHSGAIKSGQA